MPPPLNPNQLSMFVQARNFAEDERWSFLDLASTVGESRENLFRRKAREATIGGAHYTHGAWAKHGDPTLLQSINQHGIKTPVSIRAEDDTVVNGHHRIAAAHHLDPEMEVPVVWASREDLNTQAQRILPSGGKGL